MIKSILVVLIWCTMIIAFMYAMSEAAVGNKCNFGGDCGFNETCKSVPYHQRDGSSYTGICVPKEW